MMFINISNDNIFVVNTFSQGVGEGIIKIVGGRTLNQAFFRYNSMDMVYNIYGMLSRIGVKLEIGLNAIFLN